MYFIHFQGCCRCWGNWNSVILSHSNHVFDTVSWFIIGLPYLHRIFGVHTFYIKVCICYLLYEALGWKADYYRTKSERRVPVWLGFMPEVTSLICETWWHHPHRINVSSECACNFLWWRHLVAIVGLLSFKWNGSWDLQKIQYQNSGWIHIPNYHILDLFSIAKNIKCGINSVYCTCISTLCITGFYIHFSNI